MSGSKPTNPKITLHRGDLPPDVAFGASVAIDTESLGLEPQRDRLCLAQLSAGDGTGHLVQFLPGEFAAPRLKALLADPAVLAALRKAVQKLVPSTDVDDVVQTALVAAPADPNYPDNRAAFIAWLVTKGRSRAVDHLRSTGRLPRAGRWRSDRERHRACAGALYQSCKTSRSASSTRPIVRADSRPATRASKRSVRALVRRCARRT